MNIKKKQGIGDEERLGKQQATLAPSIPEPAQAMCR
jgi:hypothetical protein